MRALPLLLFFFPSAYGLTPALLGTAYSAAAIPAPSTGRCPASNPRMRVAAGELPPGLSLLPSGYIQGTPQRAGVYKFAVEFHDECGRLTQWMELEATPRPILLLSEARVQLAWERGTPLPEPIQVRVDGSSGVPYSIEMANARWLKMSQREGRIPPAGSAFSSDLLVITIDPSQLEPGHYRALVTAHAWNAGNAPRLEVLLYVKPHNDVFQALLPTLTAAAAAEAPPPPDFSALPAIVPPPALHMEPLDLRAVEAMLRRQAAAKQGPSGPLRSRVLPVPKLNLPPPSTPSKKPSPISPH